MEENITLRLPSEIQSVASLTLACPAAYEDLVVNTPVEVLKWNEGIFVLQSLSGTSFTAKVMVFEIEHAMMVDLVLTTSQVVFCYVVKGAARINDGTSHPLAFFNQQMVSGLYLPSARYQIKLSKGFHVFYYFFLKRSFLEKLSVDFPAMKGLLFAWIMGRPEALVAREGCDRGYVWNDFVRLKSKHWGIPAVGLLEWFLQELLTVSIQERRYFKASKRDIALKVFCHIAREGERGPIPGVTEVARHFAIQPRVLSRVFKSLFGVGLKAYMMQARMAAAQRLLVKERRSVCDAAYWLGYSSPYSFSNQFKKHQGYPPSEAFNRAVAVSLSCVASSD